MNSSFYGFCVCTVLFMASVCVQFFLWLLCVYNSFMVSVYVYSSCLVCVYISFYGFCVCTVRFMASVCVQFFLWLVCVYSSFYGVCVCTVLFMVSVCVQFV